ncbi:F-box protein At2g27310-like [Rhodamnia argentea]|uniref:F-box protein At2g27310-like n=1 Tax=Rhodamnia argentea TaxID=178133 RepID=A0A8B8NIP9_9MYRT|nr:F-box protein At2g27310-like [Rhodamnia argentea]
MPCSSTAPAGSNATAMLTSVHPDIIWTHILTRLDSPSLVSATSASSQLHPLSSDDCLWQDICLAVWPSVGDPRVAEAITAFPSGHRSFFSDSYPILHHHKLRYRRSPPPPLLAKYLISAVDVHFEGELIFSKVHETETASGWFECCPFQVDLLDLKESVLTRIQKPGGMHDEVWLRHLEDNLSLSWILVDPARRHAANLSTRRPVSVQRHWLTGDVQARYVTVLAGGHRGSAAEHVQCTATVTCGGEEGGKLQVREVSFQVEDMEGKILNGRDSVAILGDAMENGERKKAKRESEGKERFEEYEERKRERRERKQRKERARDLVCIGAGVAVFVGFWSFILR